MKKIVKTKLSLTTETIVHLTTFQLGAVGGGTYVLPITVIVTIHVPGPTSFCPVPTGSPTLSFVCTSR